MSENILDGIDKIETPGEGYFTQTKAEYMPLDKVIFEQKDRIAELEAINAELLEENDALKNRIAELEREVQEYKEENVKLLQQCLSLHRAVERANAELDKIEESCDNNVWFQRLKERTY